MNNKVKLRLKLNREARDQLEALADNYKGEILFRALSGIKDSDPEREITAAELRNAADSYRRLGASDAAQPGAVEITTEPALPRGQTNVWLAFGTFIFVGACVVIVAKLIPAIVHSETVQILIALLIAGLLFLFIGAVGPWTPGARSTGTLTALTSLFSKLPIRRAWKALSRKENRMTTPASGPLVARATAAAAVSPKVSAAALGGAIATIFWAIAAATWWKHTFSAATLATLTGATATILAYLLGYLKADPLRADGGASAGKSLAE